MKCIICKSELATNSIKVCKDCILNGKGKEIYMKAHKKIPSKGIECKICGNECKIDEKGFCRLRENRNGKLISYSNKKVAIGEYYLDPLPTNCVASWVCNMKSGYNLAIFYGACSFDCLFCQNWIYHEMAEKHYPLMHVDEILLAAEKAKCICFFGGDPSCQILHALEIAKRTDKIICWETNGNFSKKFLKEIEKYTNGIIKFDLKAWNENLHYALCGVSNKNSLENFEYLAKRCRVAASTLLIPYYIDGKEIYEIASFIASIDENIPYTLLAFYPCYKMKDLHNTTKKQAMECYEMARKAGLKNVRIGNKHLLI